MGRFASQYSARQKSKALSMLFPTASPFVVVLSKTDRASTDATWLAYNAIPSAVGPQALPPGVKPLGDGTGLGGLKRFGRENATPASYWLMNLLAFV